MGTKGVGVILEFVIGDGGLVSRDGLWRVNSGFFCGGLEVVGMFCVPRVS